MAGGQIELWPVNPPRNQQVAGGGTYSLIRIERAPDAGGAPGAFVEIGTVAIDVTDEYTYYRDDSGDTTAWYRYRYSNAGNTLQSGYSDPIQAGDSIVRQSVRAEFPDLDIGVGLWDRWGREVLIDLYAAGIWKLDEAEVVVTGSTVEGYPVPGNIRDVIALEQRDANGNLVRLLDAGDDRDDFDWQFGPTNRHLRIFSPSTSSGDHYWVVGKAQYRALGELTDDFFTLAMHMLYVKYAMFRQHQRLNWKKFITFDPTTDIMPRDIAGFIAQEKAEVASRVAALALPEPAIPMSY